MERIRDLALLIGRIGVGVVFIAHGWQKLVTIGMTDTVAGFEKLGIPAPALSAWFTALVETLGGAALVIGAGLPLAGVLLALVMIGALVFVHLSKGLFAANGGYEYVLVLAVTTIALGFNGGRFSVDHLFASRRAAAAAAPTNA